MHSWRTPAETTVVRMQADRTAHGEARRDHHFPSPGLVLWADLRWFSRKVGRNVQAADPSALLKLGTQIT